MTKNILIACPGKRFWEVLDNEPDVVFLDARGWWVREPGQKERKNIDVFSIEPSFKKTNQLQILRKLRGIAPTWTRWISHSDKSELLLREAMLYIIHVCAGLERFEISKIMFNTSLSHHLDTSLIEIASIESSLPQIFLYHCPVTTRLIPFIQWRHISDRKPLGFKVSKFSYQKSLEEFIQNKRKGKIPETSIIFGLKNKNPYLAFFYSYYRVLRKLATRSKALINGMPRSFFDRFPDYSTFEELRLIRRQYNAIEYYKKNTLNHSELENLKQLSKSLDKPYLLIASHYQPEATSFPEGGELFNHIDIVVELRKRGLEGPILYKEHPGSAIYFERVVGLTRVGMYRSKRYYQQLRKLGCVFLPIDMELSLDAEKNYWYLPLTIGGSLGVERSLSGFLTIYTGHPWYKGLPGMYPVEELISVLETQNCSGTRQAISECATTFLLDLLSNKTLTNVLGIGIGNGKNWNDTKSQEAFNSEFCQLMNLLRSKPLLQD